MTVVLLLLAGAEAFASGDLKVLAGYVGILAGAFAVYLAMAQVLNEALGRAVVPLFKVVKAEDKTKADGSAPE